MEKRLYKLACAGVMTGIIGSTASVLANNTTPAQVTEQEETIESSEYSLNAGVSKCLSETFSEVYIDAAVAETTESIKEITNPYEPFTYEEAYLLGKIAMAEAEGESVAVKALVIRVVINRVSSSEFPNSIEDVIYESGQFTPILDGRFDAVEPNEDCWEAFYEVANNLEDTSDGALYFESCSNEDNWHSRNLQYLFTSGKLNFYK